MSSDTKKDTVETGGEISRRALIEKAVLVVGASAASVSAVQTAFARSSDVSIDSSGKVKIDGATVVAQTDKPKKTPKKGARALDNTGCANVAASCARRRE
jgi:hypothetical protein